MEKYVKVMFDNKGANYEYKIGEVNIANNWNPKATSGKDFGGFNYATKDCILRWLHRGNIIYDVEVPKDAEISKSKELQRFIELIKLSSKILEK